MSSSPPSERWTRAHLPRAWSLRARLLVTQVLRRYLRGAPVPFQPITAPDQSAGMTLLATVAGLLFGQVKLTWADDEAELRKVLTTVMQDQAGMICFDDNPGGVADPLGDPVQSADQPHLGRPPAGCGGFLALDQDAVLEPGAGVDQSDEVGAGAHDARRPVPGSRHPRPGGPS